MGESPSTMRVVLLLAALAGIACAENWAVIVVGSKGFMNYRHHADGCHAYHILKKGGVPESNIILMMQDDVANAEENPYPGQLFNKPTDSGTPGVDVYKGCKPTYTGNQVTGKLFLDVIQGKKSANVQTVLGSTAQDNVFINFVDHGGVGIIAMPNGPNLKNTELVDALKSMHSSKMYNKLVFYMEACESGSMFQTLPQGLNIYATTAANAKESSWGTYCSPYDKVDGKKIGSCLGDLYSVNWMENSDLASSMSSETLEAQFTVVKKETNKSHCLEFGDVQSLSSLPIHDFQAEESVNVFEIQNTTKHVVSEDSDKKLASAVDSRDIALVTKFYNYLDGGSAVEAKALMDEISMREKEKAKFAQIAKLAAGKASIEVMMGQAQELRDAEWDCHHSALDAVTKACGDFNDYSLKFTATIGNLCKAGVPAEQIAKAAKQTC